MSKNNIEKEIKNAVNAIPSLVTKNKKQSSSKKKIRPHDLLDTSYNNATKEKKQLVFIGVLIIVVLIATLWIINVKSLVKNISDPTNPSQESQLFKQGSNSIQGIINGEDITEVGPNEFDDYIQKNESVERVKNTLNNLVITISQSIKDKEKQQENSDKKTDLEIISTSTIDTTPTSSTINTTTP